MSLNAVYALVVIMHFAMLCLYGATYHVMYYHVLCKKCEHGFVHMLRRHKPWTTECMTCRVGTYELWSRHWYVMLLNQGCQQSGSDCIAPLFEFFGNSGLVLVIDGSVMSKLRVVAMSTLHSHYGWLLVTTGFSIINQYLIMTGY